MLLRLLPLVTATFAVGTDNFVLAGLQPAIAADLDVTVAVAGQLVTVFALTFAVSASVLGTLTSGLDRRTALLLALGIFVVGNVVTALGTVYAAVLAARVLTAAGAGMITSVASSTAAALAPPDRRGWAMSVVLGGLSASTAVGLPLGTLIGGVNWRLTLLVIAGLGLLAMAGIAVKLPRVVLPASTLRERFAPLRRPWIVGSLLTTVLLFAGTYLLYTYIAAALTGVTHGSVGRLTLILSLFGAGSVVGTLVSGRLSDRFAPTRILTVTLLATAVVLAVGPWATAGTGTTLVWSALWGACASVSTVPLQYRLVAHAPAASPVLLGLNSSAIYLGISLGGGLGGSLLAWLEARYLGLPAAVLCLLALLLTLATARQSPTTARTTAVEEPSTEVPGAAPAP
ncbi:MFS transporter [Streptomyces sp. bgisy100]|uniref:MFS transporter n=1 Tax=Streptomyces sp. bgisy100 TaxID=3413783 RepID=UPI003D72CCCA